MLLDVLLTDACCNLQGGHPPGKVGEFYSGQGNWNQCHRSDQLPLTQVLILVKSVRCLQILIH